MESKYTGKFALDVQTIIMGGRSVDGTAHNAPSNARNPEKDNLILEK